MEADTTTSEFVLDDTDRLLLQEQRPRVPFDDARTLLHANQALVKRAVNALEAATEVNVLGEVLAERDLEYCQGYGREVLTLIHRYGKFPKPATPEEALE